MKSSALSAPVIVGGSAATRDLKVADLLTIDRHGLSPTVPATAYIGSVPSAPVSASARLSG